MSDNITNITIRLADLPRMPYRAAQSQIETIRKAENAINELWNKWTRLDEFSDKSSAEVLAMVTFRFANLYYSTLEASQNLDTVLEEVEASFDDILHADLRTSQEARETRDDASAAAAPSAEPVAD
ncbi:MAG: hypothetical protein K2G35_03510 [Duncaniella sp.]|nr:hypothetical protein [Duncaniella sp.]